MSDVGGSNGANGKSTNGAGSGVTHAGVGVERAPATAAGGVEPGSAVPPPVKVIEFYPPPEPDELPPPTFKQALVGYGSILLGLVLLGVLLGSLMRLLR